MTRYYRVLDGRPSIYLDDRGEFFVLDLESLSARRVDSVPEDAIQITLNEAGRTIVRHCECIARECVAAWGSP